MAYQAVPYVRYANYYETDKMGIVHHSNHIRWMEEARLDYMKQSGMDYADVERNGIIMPVTDISCRYKIAIRFDEEVEIRVKLIAFNGIRATYHYEIYTLNDKKLAASGESSHCFLDEKTRVPMNLKKRYPDFYKQGIQLLKEEGTNSNKE